MHDKALDYFNFDTVSSGHELYMLHNATVILVMATS